MDALVNGAFTDTVSVYDRGLAYGDGVFESIAVHKGECFLFVEHMLRLRQGCRRLGISAPSIEQCRNEIERLCAGRTGILKLIITRGAGIRGYAAAGDMQPNRLLLFSSWDPCPKHYYTQGITAKICRIRLSGQKELAGIKHLNRLENVLAAQEFDTAAAQEGLMLDSDNRIIEGIRSNIFFIKDEELYTPGLERCGISGVMRNCILQSARTKGVTTHIRDIYLEEAQHMDEAFVCNSVIGVWPIARLEDKISYRLIMTRSVQDWVAEYTLGFVSAHD